MMKRPRIFTVWLSDEEHERLSAIAESNDMPMASQVRRWIRDTWAKTKRAENPTK